MYAHNMSFYDAQQAALGFLISQTSFIEPQVIAIRYPDIQYQRLIPIDTSAPEWTKSITFFSSDKVGRADWFHAAANDIPKADVVREKFEQAVEMAGIGYGYNLEELGQAMMVPGTNLSTERAEAARRAYEEFVDDIALRGNETKDWEGLINNSAVTIANATADGDNSSSTWEDKTADQILRDVNAVVTGVWVDSLTVEMCDTLLLPLESLTALATRRIPDTAITILEFLRKYNAYSMQTGGTLNLDIIGVRGLETAGADGGGRMVAYRRDPQVLKMHIPMPHRFLPVWQRGPISFDVPGIFRLGGLEIRRPGAVRYVDGILAPPGDSA